MNKKKACAINSKSKLKNECSEDKQWLELKVKENQWLVLKNDRSVEKLLTGESINYD